MSTTQTTTTRYTIWISDGSEIDDFGRIAAVAVSHTQDEDGTWELDDSGVYVASAAEVIDLDDMTPAEINTAAAPLVAEVQAKLATVYGVTGEWGTYRLGHAEEYAATDREWMIEVTK